MTRKSPLRAVEPGEKSEKSEPKKILTLAEAIETDDYLEILLAQRRDIVTALPDEKGPAKAAMHRQLSILSKEIEGLRAQAEEEAEDAEAGGDEAWDAEAI